MKIPFTSEEAKQLNEDIFETIYYGDMETSIELARDREELMKQYKQGLINESEITIIPEELDISDPPIMVKKRKYKPRLFSVFNNVTP